MLLKKKDIAKNDHDIQYPLTLHCSQSKCTEEEHGKFGGHFLGVAVDIPDDKKKFMSFNSDGNNNNDFYQPILNT